MNRIKTDSTKPVILGEATFSSRAMPAVCRPAGPFVFLRMTTVIIFPCLSVPSVVKKVMDCRPNCGACCIAPSISSPIPGMPHGKRAGERCVQLLPDLRCALFGKPGRPAVCASLRPTEEMCGASRDAAIAYLAALESATG
jgi:hypothetical protein